MSDVGATALSSIGNGMWVPTQENSIEITGSNSHREKFLHNLTNQILPLPCLTPQFVAYVVRDQRPSTWQIDCNMRAGSSGPMRRRVKGEYAAGLET